MTKITILCGGVGGARMARGFASVLPPSQLTVVVNVADDDTVYGVRLSPDLDTVVYTLAGVEGPHGWGRAEDSGVVMQHLSALGVDTTFHLGDKDLALNLWRTMQLNSGVALSRVTARICEALDVDTSVVPASDDPIRTQVETADGVLAFQEYFVVRQHRDRVHKLRFEGIESARPAPGVLDAIVGSDIVVIAPSNPALSIWPILGIDGVRAAISSRPWVIGVSPLFGGKALKGPAATLLDDLGYQAGTRGIIDAYDGLLTHLVVDESDAADASAADDTTVVSADTRIAEAEPAARLAKFIMGLT